MLDPGVVHKEITMDGCYLGMEDPDTSQIEFLNSHDVGASDTQQRASISSDLNTDFFDPDNFLSNDGPQSNDLAVFCKNGSYNSPMSQLPLSFSFSQMGPAAYADVAAKGPLLVRGPHGQLHRTNSLFSDHITVVEHFLRQKWLNAGALLNRGDEWYVKFSLYFRGSQRARVHQDHLLTAKQPREFSFLHAFCIRLHVLADDDSLAHLHESTRSSGTADDMAPEPDKCFLYEDCCMLSTNAIAAHRSPPSYH